MVEGWLMSLGSDCPTVVSWDLSQYLVVCVLFTISICCWFAFNVRDSWVVLVRRYLAYHRSEPLEAPMISISHVRSHGTLYPMTDYIIRTIVLHLPPMSADAPWDSIRFYYRYLLYLVRGTLAIGTITQADVAST